MPVTPVICDFMKKCADRPSISDELDEGHIFLRGVEGARNDDQRAHQIRCVGRSLRDDGPAERVSHERRGRAALGANDCRDGTRLRRQRDDGVVGAM